VSVQHRYRILIADDHLLVAEACKKLLDVEFEVVGVVTDGRALLQAVFELCPDVIVVDVGMPILNGLDACEQIKKKSPALKVVFLTMTESPEVAAEALRRGASGYVLKHCGADELSVAVRGVLRGESYLSPAITKGVVEFLLANPTAESETNLSSRQREVLQLLAEGKAMKEVAYLLGLKLGTVAFHKYKMMEKLGVTSSAQLIEYAIRQHMLA
jgi:DNA-binding NarL/FixJ family response regulator